MGALGTMGETASSSILHLPLPGTPCTTSMYSPPSLALHVRPPCMVPPPNNQILPTTVLFVTHLLSVNFNSDNCWTICSRAQPWLNCHSLLNYCPLFVRIFGRFGYGFGLVKNSPFTHQFSVNILELRQKGYIETLKSKWLTGPCQEERHDTSKLRDHVMVQHVLSWFYFN